MKKRIFGLCCGLIMASSLAFVGCDGSTINGVSIKNPGKENMSAQIEGLPTLEEKNGFAGEWVATVTGDKVELTPTWGDGSKFNPYKISTETQFKRLLDDWTQETSVKYYDGQNAEVVSPEAAVKKVVVAPTYKAEYEKNAKGSWVGSVVEKETVYFELINDIDFSSWDESFQVGGGWATIGLDGNGYALKNLNGLCFENNGNAIFDTLFDSEIKNLEVNSNIELTEIASVVSGQTTFENVTTTATGLMKFADENDGDRNRGAFVSFVLSGHTSTTFNLDTDIVFKNCVNNVNILSTASYNGIFIGGYAYRNSSKTDNVRIVFDGCENYGYLKSSNKAALFIGNGSQTLLNTEVGGLNENSGESGIVVKNCVNAAVIEGRAGSHILSVDVSTDLSLSSIMGVYDSCVDVPNVIKFEQGSSFTDTKKTSFTLANDGHDIIITQTEGEVEYELDKDAYSYELIVWKGVSYRAGGNFRINLIFNDATAGAETIVYGENTITYKDVFYDFYVLSALDTYTGHQNIDTNTLEKMENVTFESNGNIYDGVYKYTPADLIHTTPDNGNHPKDYDGLYIVDDVTAENPNGYLYGEGRYNPGNKSVEAIVNFRFIVRNAAGEIVEVLFDTINSSETLPEA